MPTSTPSRSSSRRPRASGTGPAGRKTESRTRPRLGSQADRFAAFALAVGLELEGFQREIVEESFSDRRELLVLLPRGNGKSTLFAALALYSLITTREPAIYIAAASRDQASVLFDIARRMVERDPYVESVVTVRHRELRANGGVFKVLASDAPKQHGLIPSLVLVDELHAHRNAELYEALRTAMHKVPDSRMVTISTAGVADGEGPLIDLRKRALAQPEVSRDGAKVTAYGSNLAMLEWAVPEGADISDMAEVKKANPASWIAPENLQEQYEAVHELAFRRYHCNQWTAVEQHWLPPGAWQACASEYVIEQGESVWVGVDVGGSRAASAVVWVTEDLRVGSAIFQGDEAVLAVVEKLRDLAQTYDVRAVYYDPWRFQAPAIDLEREGMLMVEFPQSQARMIPASERLHAVVTEGRLRHSNGFELNRHVASAIAADTPRGWKLDKSTRSAQIDAVVALAMAVEAAETAPQAHTGPLMEWLA